MTDVSLSASQCQSSLVFVEVTPEPRLKKREVAASDFLYLLTLRRDVV